MFKPFLPSPLSSLRFTPPSFLLLLLSSLLLPSSVCRCGNPGSARLGTECGGSGTRAQEDKGSWSTHSCLASLLSLLPSLPPFLHVSIHPPIIPSTFTEHQLGVGVRLSSSSWDGTSEPISAPEAHKELSARGPGDLRGSSWTQAVWGRAWLAPQV